MKNHILHGFPHVFPHGFSHPQGAGAKAPQAHEGAEFEPKHGHVHGEKTYVMLDIIVVDIAYSSLLLLLVYATII